MQLEIAKHLGIVTRYENLDDEVIVSNFGAWYHSHTHARQFVNLFEVDEKYKYFDVFFCS